MSRASPLPPSALRSLVVGSANRKKAAELVDLLAHGPLQVETLADVSQPLAVEETGTSMEENARLKATLQAAHLGRWVLGDDSGLVVDALGGAPGILSARFAGPSATDLDNRRRLLEQLGTIEWARRTARFVCHLVLADPTGAVRAQSAGQCQGRIRREEAGSGGFGYDPLFEIVEYHRTFGELSSEVKSCLSHRARAVYALAPQIEALIESGAWDARG